MLLYIILGVTLIAIIVLLVLWLRQRKKKKLAAAAEAGETAAPGGDEIGLLIREAEAKLAKAKLGAGAKAVNLPVYFVLGEAGGAKTSVVLHSGLEAELIAGQVYQSGNVTPTRSANVWFAHRSLFIEAGGRLMAEPPKWHKLIARLKPRASVVGRNEQAPRAALVCFDCEIFTRSGALEAAASAARDLRARLGEISQAMGINLPVYVLFTKMDRVPYFTEFVRNLSEDEVAQVVGVTLPILGRRSEGVYGDEETARLTGSYERLFRSLADARTDFLGRETDPSKLPAAYEFAREFRKLRTVAVQFMVDLCRPSQLTVGPFLRGFYFTGVRPVVINETAPIAPAAEQGGYGSAAGATGIFHVGGVPKAAPVQQQVVGSRKVPQWVFLSRLFHQILLADRGALGASGSSTRTSFARRVLLMVAASLLFLLAIAFTVSFFRNRGLESEVLDASRALQGVSAGADLAPVDSLRKLDALRESTQQLAEWRRDGAPWSYRWGLYTGDDLYPDARRLYFDRFKQLLFGQTQGAILQNLSTLPATPGPEYGPTYNALKAYLITTSNNDKSTRDFLSPVLLQWWSNGRTVDSDRQQLATKQFDFYADELKESNPFSSANDPDAVAHARQYLAQFAGFDAVYNNLLAEAGGKNPSINFNRMYAGSALTVVESHEVSGAFSKGGWGYIKDVFNHPERLGAGERWVLGDQAPLLADRAKLVSDLRARYYKDFIGEWRTYIKSGKVVAYANLKDASQKLQSLSGNSSALLALLCVASTNTAVDDAATAALFQPVQAVVPAPCKDKLILDPNKNYMGSLLQLQGSVDAVASQPGPPDASSAGPVLGAAASAKQAAGTVAQGFSTDPDGHVDSAVSTLLLEPITNVDGLVRMLGPGEMNGKGKDLCGQMRPLLSKYPFTASSKVQASMQDIDAIFKPNDGLLWQSYQQNFAKAITKVGSQYVAASSSGMTINQGFLNFLNRAQAFTDAAYANGATDPHIAYTVQFVPTTETDSAKLTVDGQTGDFTATATGPKPFVWPGATHGVQGSVHMKGGSSYQFGGSYDGLWGIFAFVDDADRHIGSQVQMTLKSGKSDQPVKDNGRPVTVTFDLRANPPVFDKGYFSGLACVGDVARP